MGAALLLAACGGADDELDEPDRGSLTDVIDNSQRRVWPGVEVPGQGRVIQRINGFVDDRPIDYWFAGLVRPSTADIYWFCRDQDTECPLDAAGAVDFSRTVGRPVFARIPGEQSYSPYWWIKVIRVPEDYRPDSIKSVFGIEQAIAAGRARLDWFYFNHRRWVGPDKAIEHTLLVLDGTVLEGNGESPPGRPDVTTRYVQRRQGWHKQFRVQYYDFSAIEGVLPPADEEQEEWLAPRVPTAELYMLFRDCAAGADSPACSTGGRMSGAVTERTLSLSLTGDGDLSDTNNVLGALPGRAPSDPDDPLYSPSWAVMEVRVAPESDADVRLIDTTGDQRVSDVRSVATVQKLVADGVLRAPIPVTGDRVGGPTDGPIFFDCATQLVEP